MTRKFFVRIYDAINEIDPRELFGEYVLYVFVPCAIFGLICACLYCFWRLTLMF